MKNILQYIANIMIFISVSIVSFFQMLWYGKLPKVSIYHNSEDCRFEGLLKSNFEDKDTMFKKIRADEVPTNIKEYILRDFMHDVIDYGYCPELTDKTFKIKDSKGRIMGYASFMATMDNLINIYTNKYKKL